MGLNPVEAPNLVLGSLAIAIIFYSVPNPRSFSLLLRGDLINVFDDKEEIPALF